MPLSQEQAQFPLSPETLPVLGVDELKRMLHTLGYWRPALAVGTTLLAGVVLAAAVSAQAQMTPPSAAGTRPK